uniref:Major acrosomal protein n=1 Tax=Tegula brunnea TaxID=80345 RepID=Q9NIV7_TEGBR|nr:major acrosomal protein precursor [Tegula brunnea]
MLLRILLPLLMLVSIIWAMPMDESDEDFESESDSLSNELERERRGLSKEERREKNRLKNKCLRGFLKRYDQGATIVNSQGKKETTYTAGGGLAQAEDDYNYLRGDCGIGKRRVTLDGDTITIRKRRKYYVITY